MLALMAHFNRKFGLADISVIIILIIFFLQCTDQTVSSSPFKINEIDNLSYSVITDQLTIPWQMAFTPDGRILISERNGLVKVVKEQQLQPEPWLDLRDSLRTSDAATTSHSGLMGLAIDPDFENNGYIYLGYSYEAEGKDYDYNKLVRYKEYPGTGKGVFDRILFDHVKGFSMHNSGQIKFGPDGKIYWSVGDRHETASAQNLQDESGSILRLNADGTIPDDNPFPGLPVYAYGLRNSQGFDWHPNHGIMLATEHGPSGGSIDYCCFDEINRIEAGKNYGWPIVRGKQSAEGMEPPILHSGEGSPVDDFTWAPSGATFVHTGPWKGSFLFGGLRSNSMWQLVFDDRLNPAELNRFHLPELGRIRSVDQQDDGIIYLITSNRDRGVNGISDKDYLIRIDSK